jgi:hypothetical protein
MSASNQTLFADGFDDCIIGYVNGNSVDSYRIVYDSWKMVDVLCERDSMTRVEALEYLEHNTWSAYAGKGTPLYVDVTPNRQDIEDLLIDNQ